MNTFRKVATAAIALSFALVSAAPTQAASTQQQHFLPEGSIAGLIVKYESGVSRIAANGQPTAENAAGEDLKLGQAVGLGWYTVDFANEVSSKTASLVAQKLESDPRVAQVDFDMRIVPASVKASQSAYSAIKAAAAVRSLTATDGWSAETAGVTRVLLRWKAPTATGGGKIVGYRIEKSTDGKAWKTFKANTGSLATTAFVDSGLVAGNRYFFRVSAVTALGAAVKVGLPSISSSIAPTSAPQPPVFNGSNVAFGGTAPSWLRQSLAQTGGLPVTYTATATADGQPQVSCSTKSTSCSFAGLAPNITYSVVVTAANTRGATSSLPGVRPLDAFFSKQWYLTGAHGINASNAWAQTLGSKKVVVAILDSGISKHPDLDSNVIPGYDFVSSAADSNDGDGRDADASDPGDYVGNQLSSWHGTHVAGIVGAQANSIGITGVAPNVLLQSVRVLGSAGGRSADLVAAINWASGIHVDGVPDNITPAKVINLSIEAPDYSQCDNYASTSAALAAAKAKNITVVTAAGNDNEYAYNIYPGNCYPTINVGATGPTGDKASYSNFGWDFTNGVDIAAPGGEPGKADSLPEGVPGGIYSTVNEGNTVPTVGGYASYEGTSMAAPVVSGVVALIYSVRPDITADQIWDVLKANVTPFAAGTICQTTGKCGAGIVNAAASVAAAKALP